MSQELLDKLFKRENIGIDSTINQKQEVIDVLRKLVNELKEERSRSALTADSISTLCRFILEVFVVAAPSEESTVAEYDDDGSVDVILLSECLRCLRNACVQNEGNQNAIGQSNAIQCIRNLVTILCSSKTTSSSSDSSRILIRCAVQVAGNLVSGNPKMRLLVWRMLFPQSLVSIFQYNDARASTYCCMLINECLSSDDLIQQQLMKQPEGHDIVSHVLRLSEDETQQDFSLQIMQKLLTTSDFMLSTYDSLPTTSKIIVLDILAAMLSHESDGPTNAAIDAKDGSSDRVQDGEGVNRDGGSVPAFSVAYLAEQFEELAGKGLVAFVTVEQDRESTENKTPLLILRLLTVLGIASAANHEVYKPLQDRESLLQTAIDVLQRAHLASTSREEPSAAKPPPPTTAGLLHEKPIGSNNQSASMESGDKGPVYGLKRDLVRLIGNMCYRHRTNQDKVRELHGIPLILEHCNIDDQNPFISQWAIFAIRNLCEDNHDNQQYIAAMTTKGAAPTTEFLRGMGVEVEMRGDVPYIKSTTNKK